MRKTAGIDFYTFPREALAGLWHGQGIGIGYNATRTNKKFKKTWHPNAQAKSYHSVLLGKTFHNISTTVKCMKAIDMAGGFDNYILYTPIWKMNSILALTLREVMEQKLKLDPTAVRPEKVVKPTFDSRGLQMTKMAAKRSAARSDAKAALLESLKRESSAEENTFVAG